MGGGAKSPLPKSTLCSAGTSAPAGTPTHTIHGMMDWVGRNEGERKGEARQGGYRGKNEGMNDTLSHDG